MRNHRLFRIVCDNSDHLFYGNCKTGKVLLDNSPNSFEIDGKIVVHKNIAQAANCFPVHFPDAVPARIGKPLGLIRRGLANFARSNPGTLVRRRPLPFRPQHLLDSLDAVKNVEKVNPCGFHTGRASFFRDQGVQRQRMTICTGRPSRSPAVRTR